MRTLLATLLLAVAPIFPSGAHAQKEGVEVQKSKFLLVPATTVERAAAGQYTQMMRQAARSYGPGTEGRDTAEDIEQARMPTTNALLRRFAL